MVGVLPNRDQAALGDPTHAGSLVEAPPQVVVDRLFSFSYPRPELAAVGWCHLRGRAVDDLWVLAGGLRLPCLTGLPRPDVARQAGARGLERSGFVCRLPATAAFSRVELVARQGGVDERVGALPFGSRSELCEPESESHQYATWLRTHAQGLYWTPREIQERLRSLHPAPQISVILPTHNTHPYHLHRCVQSVIGQFYPHWQLCISDDASGDSRVREYLLGISEGEPRIHLLFSQKRGGISAASNEAIAAASGEFLVLLDHDDELHPCALLEVARSVCAHPDVDLIYSDEDKIDQIGIRSYPTFKPEFDEDLFCGFNYLGHLVATRASLVRDVGGFRSDADGAQDWDLLLRVTAATSPERIEHIPKPLYHWRMHEDSTALSLDAKPYAIRAWRGVLERHVLGDESCSVREGLFLGSMRVVRRLADDVSVSVLYRAADGWHQQRALRRSRLPRMTTFFEVVLSSVYQADRPDGRALLTPHDLQSAVTIVVNSRLDGVNHHFLEELAAQALRADIGVAGGTILRPDGKVLTAGLACLSDGTYVNPFEDLDPADAGYMGQARVVRSVPAIGPQVFAFRTARLAQVNGLARVREDSLDDLCDALIRSSHVEGLKVLHTPYAVATLRSTGATYHPRQGPPPPAHSIVNQNLERFPSVTAALRSGIL